MKKWVPSDYVDEITPPPRETPDAWIEDYGNLAAIDDAHPPQPLAEGEIVNFSWVETLGSVTITIAEDGSWTSNPPIPETPEGACSHIWAPFDPDTMSFDVDSFASAMLENDGPGEIDAEIYAWSIENTPYRFHAGRFVSVKEATEREG